MGQFRLHAVGATGAREINCSKFNISIWVASILSDTANMAFPVVEFSRQGYKIRKVFG